MSLNPAVNTATRLAGAAIGFATGSWLLASCCGVAGVILRAGFELDFGSNFNGIVSNFAHQLASGQIARLTGESPSGQLQLVAATALSDAMKEIASTVPPDYRDWMVRCIAGLKANAWIAVMPPAGWFVNVNNSEESGELFWKLLEASLAYATASRPAGLTLMHLSEPKLDEGLRTYLRNHLPEALGLNLRNELAANDAAWRYAYQATLDLLPGIDQKLDRIEQWISQSAAPAAMDKPSNAPAPSGHFFGREHVLSRIESLLKGGHKVCLWAEGGVGKTQTVASYVASRKVDYTAILWIDASSSATFRNSYESFLPLAGLIVATDSGLNIGRVREWLERSPRWLMVLDNVDLDDQVLLNEITAALPGGPNGHMLATSRHNRIDALGRFESLELELFTPTESIAFLRQRTGRQSTEDDQGFERIGGLLGYLPLALEQAAAYLVQEEEAPASYAQRLEARGLALLEKYPPGQGNYAHSVRTTWSLSMERVAARSPGSLSLLEVSAVLDAVPIPYVFAAAVLELTDLAEVNEFLTPLARYSLIRRSVENRPTRCTGYWHRL